MSGEGGEGGGPSRDEVEKLGNPRSFGPDRERVGQGEKFKPLSEFDLIGALTPPAIDTIFTTNNKMNDELDKAGENPTPKPAEKKSVDGRDRYQPNALVRKFLAEADAEAIRKGFIPPSDEVMEEDLRQIKEFANAPKGELAPPEQFFIEVETLPVSYEQTAAIILSIAPMPKHIQDRIRKNPESDLTPKELAEIYKGVRKKLERNPKAAKLADLSHIIESEISGILKEHEESGQTIDAANMYNDPTVVKLSSLSKSEDAIERIRRGESLEPTSAEALALDDYLRKKIDSFTKLKSAKKKS